MEAMASSLKPPTCVIKCSRGSFCKPYDKTTGNWPLGLRPRPSRRLRVECAASGLQEMKPLQASKLQEKFGSENLRFLDVGGRTVIELKMNSGTSARLLLQEARITSYNCRLWHGSLEEFLYTDLTEFNAEGSIDSDDSIVHGETPQQFTVIGGIAPSILYSLDPNLSLFHNWSIQSVDVNPEEHIQVTLKCVNEDRGGWHFKLLNVITLTNEGLAFALLLTNKDRKPLMFTASVSTHLAIRSTKAISCAGLDGCDYYSPSEAAIKGAQDNSFLEKLKRFVLPFQLDESKEKVTSDNVKGVDEMSEGDSDEDEKHWFIEKPGELVSLANGVHKLYLDPPNRVRITDEGFRRSLVFENHGFENLEVASPDADGEKPFVSIGYGTVLSSITLNKGDGWRGALILAPDTK